MQIDASSREQYFVLARERAAELRELDGLIRHHAPALTPTLSPMMGLGTMLGYGQQAYQSQSMKEPVDWPVVALAAQKRHLSLYVCAVVDGVYVAERYADVLGKVSCGKSCIRFTRVDALDRDALRSMLIELDTRYAAGEKLY